MKKHTKLQEMLAEALNKEPDSPDVTNVIEATALWLEFLLDEMGIVPTALPSLLRWQYYHTEWFESTQHIEIER